MSGRDFAEEVGRGSGSGLGGAGGARERQRAGSKAWSDGRGVSGEQGGGQTVRGRGQRRVQTARGRVQEHPGAAAEWRGGREPQGRSGGVARRRRGLGWVGGAESSTADGVGLGA